MCFSPPMGLRVQHSTTSGQASLLLPQTHPILLYCPPLPMPTTALEDPLHSLLPMLLLLACHLLPSWPPVAQKVNNLLTPHLPLSTTSCQCQMQTSLLMVKLAPAQSNRRSMDQQPSYQPVKNSRASNPPSRTFWNPSFDHQIAMIDYFKLDLGTTDAYITLDLLVLHRLWVMKQLTDMKYVVDGIDDEGELVVWLHDFCLLCTPSSCSYFTGCIWKNANVCIS